MNASCGRRLTEATFTCVRGFPYGRLYASRMDDTAETQVDQPRQRHDRQHKQCREPAMGPLMRVAIFFAPKEASVSARSVGIGGVAILLHDCLLGNHLFIPFPYRVLWLDQSVTCLEPAGPIRHAPHGIHLLFLSRIVVHSRVVVETSTDQSDRERLWCDINDLRHVEVDGSRPAAGTLVELVKLRMEHKKCYL